MLIKAPQGRLDHPETRVPPGLPEKPNIQTLTRVMLAKAMSAKVMSKIIKVA
jgi:hypothetical protein